MWISRRWRHEPAFHALWLGNREVQPNELRRLQPQPGRARRADLRHAEHEQRLRAAAQPTASAIHNSNAHSALRTLRQRRALLGGWDGLLRRRRRARHGERRAEDLRGAGGLYHYHARHGLLQQAHGGVRQPQRLLDRGGADRGRDIRRRDGQEQHHRGRRRGLHGALQGRRRHNDKRGHGAPREQQDYHRPRGRADETCVLRE